MTAGLAERRAVRTVLPVPEPDLTPAELIARAAALKPLLRQQQAENDERGFYSQELHQAFLDAGLYRTLQPRMFGGYEFDIPTFYRAMLEISHGHPSAGWCLTLCASHPFLIASHWSERAQRELFGPDGDFAAPHRVPPTGMLTPAEGGYRLTGLWDFCSGVPHSTHLVCGARLPVADGPPEVFCVAVPREELRILDDWGGDRTLGMRASGSHSVEIKDAFIPAHHAVPLQGLFTRPEDMRSGTPGTRLHGNPMYLGRVAGPYHMSLITPVIGAAKAALDEYQDLIRTKNTNFPPIVPRAEHEDFQRALGQATILADAAENSDDPRRRGLHGNVPALGERRHADHRRTEPAVMGDAAAGRPHGLRRGRAFVQERRHFGGAQGQPHGAISAGCADVSRPSLVFVRELLGAGRPRASRITDPAFQLLARDGF